MSGSLDDHAFSCDIQLTDDASLGTAESYVTTCTPGAPVAPAFVFETACEDQGDEARMTRVCTMVTADRFMLDLQPKGQPSQFKLHVELGGETLVDQGGAIRYDDLGSADCGYCATGSARVSLPPTN